MYAVCLTHILYYVRLLIINILVLVFQSVDFEFYTKEKIVPNLEQLRFDIYELCQSE